MVRLFGLFILAFIGIVQISFSAVYTVTVTSDLNPGGGGNPGDLRWCMTQANLGAGPHKIQFAAGITGGTITINTVLPTINQNNIQIDGAAQNITINTSGTNSYTLRTNPGIGGFSVKGLRLITANSQVVIFQSATVNDTVINCNLLTSNYINATIIVTGAGTCSGIIINGNTASGVGGFFFSQTASQTNFESRNNVLACNTNNDVYTFGGNLSNGVISTNTVSVGRTFVAAGTSSFSNFTSTSNIINSNGGSGYVIQTANGFLINSNRVIGNSNNGIRITNTNNGIIKNNFIRGFQSGGVDLSNGSNNIMSNNALVANQTFQTSFNNISYSSIQGDTIGNSLANTDGIILLGTSKRNSITGCYIGVTTGGVSFPNTKNGIFISSATATNNTIGGYNISQRNIVSANLLDGILVQADSTKIIGNYVGISPLGTIAMPNGPSTSNQYNAIHIKGASAAVPIKYSQVVNNVLSSLNNGRSLYLEFVSNDLYQNNTAGLAADGVTPLGNGRISMGSQNFEGSCIHYKPSSGASNSVILNNTLAACASNGIGFEGAVSTVTISGNKIGVNVYGLAPNKPILANSATGIYFSGSATNFLIGGSNKSDRNIISNNGAPQLVNSNAFTPYYQAISFDGGTATNVTIAGNYMGTDSTGLANVGNSNQAIYVPQGSNGLVIGLPTRYGRNIIGGNSTNLSGASAPYATSKEAIQLRLVNDNTLIQNNFIGVGIDGITKIPNGKMGIGFNGGSGTNRIIGGCGTYQRNVISGNTNGISINRGTSAVTIIGNYIGTDSSGNYVAGLGNTFYGVGVDDGTSGSTIGQVGCGNIIRGNGAGVYFGKDETSSASTNGSGNLVVANTISNNTNGISIGVNTYASVNYGASTGNTIGGIGAGMGNTIYNNTSNGITIYDANTTNTIRRNSIYCNGSAGVNGINLNLDSQTAPTVGGNNRITINQGYGFPPSITSLTGVTFNNTTVTGGGSALNASDKVEVYIDAPNSCGTCQGKTYLGDATVQVVSGKLNWSFPAGSIPSYGYCSTTIPAGTCPSGLINVTATRTDAAGTGNTSQFSGCTPLLILPVEFLTFTANLNKSNQVVLDWIVVKQENNDFFIIEKSSDGNHFDEIGKVKSITNSNLPISYNFLDKFPFQGISYYRVKQVDLDGSFVYSTIISVQLSGVDVQLFPNPTKGLLNIGVSSSEKIQIQAALFNTLGDLILSKVLNVDLGYSMNQIDLSSFSSGIYNIQLLTNGKTTNYKIVKE